MSREVRRVPLDFAWPKGKVWDGYLMPDRFEEDPCPACTIGYSPRAQELYDQWYGKTPFHPGMTGSTPMTAATPVVRAFAVRNVTASPDFYGTGEAAVVREATRLAALFNGAWSHHIAQDDVAALVAAGRLRDFTHTWTREDGWQPKDPPVTPTAAQVNEWSVSGFGHDSINASVVIRARCEREGVTAACPSCQGHGSVEAYPGQRAEAEAWEPAGPPAGDGWQLWKTVTEGAPVTPVFASADALVRHLVSAEGFTVGAAETLVEQGSTVGTFVGAGGMLLDSAKDADVVDALGDPDKVFTDTDTDMAAATAEWDLERGIE